ncbi:hypothetical protein N9Z78_02160 [Akkermansiaceae bacterium]|nr:hypothetical protein [Akkermansiaceae bacterium]
MKRSFVFLLSLALWNGSFANVLLYEESFDDASLENFEVVNDTEGSITLTDGIATSLRRGKLVTKNDLIPNSTINLRFRINDGFEQYFFFSTDGETLGPFRQLFGSFIQFKSGRVQIGISRPPNNGASIILSSALPELKTNEWVDLSIQILDETVTVSLLGKSFSATAPEFALRGKFGFHGKESSNLGVSVDDIKVYIPFNLQIIEGNFTWHEAKADAEAKGGRLAVLDTQEKIDAANAFVVEAGFSEDLWLGLTDQDSEGEWAWLNGEPLATADWGQRQPEGGSWGGQPENYAILHFGDRKWHDVPNNWGADYLLEILVLEPAPPVVELESFYESNPNETIVVDATPTEGFPAEFTYQWSFNDQPIPSFLGGTLPTFNLLGDQSQDGTWTVLVSNAVGSTEASFEYRVFVDNDSDGLSNYREENITLTNPDLADSDADGLSDPDELSIHGTDPNVADVDEDGLNDSEEIAATTDPSVADTDNDGLLDGAEVNTYASNPRSGDTDNDGIADAAELAAGLDINTAESIADAVAFLTQELANRPPVDGFEDALIEARASGRNDVTTNPSQYDLYDKATYDAVVADRDSRPTLAEYALIVEDRDSRPTLQAYNAVVADRDSRPTKEVHDAVIAERDARVTLEEVKDGRLGSVLLLPDTATNKVKLRFCIEESDELGAWTSRTEEAEVDIPLAAGKRFFRFSVKEDE